METYTKIFVITLIVLFNISTWTTHVITCINREEWLFLIAGAIAVPIGIIHGFGIWIGVW